MMPSFQLQIKDRPPRIIGPESPPFTVGRAPGNDWVVEDPSISRLHARFKWAPEGLLLEDLGSRNGTTVDGTRIEGPVTVKPGQEVILGHVLFSVGVQGAPAVLIDAGDDQNLAHATLVMSAAKLRDGMGAGAPTGEWPQMLAFIHRMTLGLIRDVTPQELLEDLVEQLFKHFSADRGVVLVVDAQGALEPQVVRTRSSQSKDRIRLSHTLVEAAMERREAILINDPLNEDPGLASKSLILSGVSSVLVTPLEAEGKVIGLLYFDAKGPRRTFCKDDLQLATTLAHVAAAKIQGARLLAEVARTRALEQEMAIARTIQQRMVPQSSPRQGPVDLHAELRPAKEVGGDLFDYDGQDGRFYFCIGDVSGKGVPAALVMAITKTLFRSNARFLEDPARLMAAVNARLYEETDPTMFVTAFCGFFDPETGRVLYCNAGHDRPLVLAPGRPARVLEARPGLALGVLPEFKFQVQELTLAPGETLVLYTDGVTEALDPSAGMFTLARLQAALDGAPGEPEALVRHILAAVDAFAQGAPQADDITVMCLRNRRPE